jgi:nitrite reductase (NO-forming)
MSNETEHPIGEAPHPVYRTTAARTGKMMIIMLGICIVGAIIFFSMWDYWISQPAPVVAMMAGEADHAAPAAATGKTITQDLTFIESSDFRTLAFDALPGEDGNNPTIQMNVGDTVVFNVDNGGVSFHSFGVTKADEGFAGIIPGSDIGSASNPLKPGEDGSSEFVAGEEGTYYYICTVPGHREQGMVGEIIIGPAQGGSSSGEAAAPTGVSHEFTLDFVESDDFRTLAFNALPGEDGHNPEIRVNSGDEVTITANNNGKSFHAFGVVTNPEDFNSTIWDSEIAAMSNPLKPGEGGTTTFTAGAPGTYYYICTVPGHALQGMQGSFIVE